MRADVSVFSPLQLPTSSTSRRGGYSYGFDLRLDPIRLDHAGALKWLSTEEHDLEDSQQAVDPTEKNVGNCKRQATVTTRGGQPRFAERRAPHAAWSVESCRRHHLES